MRLMLVSLLLGMVVGCGKQSAGPTTYPVAGLVTLAGAPVGGANVQFTPTSPDLGIAGAQATTNADGTFEVQIQLDMGKTSKDGLPAGDYRVAITKLELPQGQSTATKAPKNVLPAKYAMADASQLTATVKADGENRFEFPLTK